jgi:hypothetical protein
MGEAKSEGTKTKPENPNLGSMGVTCAIRAEQIDVSRVAHITSDNCDSPSVYNREIIDS